MTGSTNLLRQIHKSFIQNGRVSSQAFRPTPKDKNLLSVYNGDDIPKDAFMHYTKTLKLTSYGVLAIPKEECDGCCLPVRSDPALFKEHCVIDFTGMSDSQRKNAGTNSVIMLLRVAGSIKRFLCMYAPL